MSDSSSMNQGDAKMRLLGKPPTLPLRVAVQVAMTSIRVRLSRSLVTVSSVVLAVAFLLNVLGENVGNHAVYQEWERDSASSRHAQALRDALSRPRENLALLQVLHDKPQEVAAWHAALGGKPLTVSPATVTLALELSRWLDALNPSQSYLIRRNRSGDEWLAAFIGAEQVDAFILTAGQLKGVRLDFTREQLMSLTTEMPSLQDALAALAASEDARLEGVVAAGGTEKLLLTLAETDTVDPVLLPLDQILGEVDTDARTALRHQIQRDRARLQAAEVVSRFNANDPSLLTAADVDIAALKKAVHNDQPAVQQFLAVSGWDAANWEQALSGGQKADPKQVDVAIEQLNQTLSVDGFYRRDAFKKITLDSETMAMAKRVRMPDRQRTRLNRLLLQATFPGVFTAVPPVRSLDLATVLSADQDPALSGLRTTVAAAAAPVTLPELAEEVQRRQRLADLERTFQSISYDPASGAQKTFWLVVLSLLVCIVGIVNTMMMAVTERFREIATMKCLGAMDSFILKSFLIESGMVGTLGSLLGAVIGLALVLLQISIRYGESFWHVIPIADFAIVAGGTLLCGLVLAIIGALLPALKAARMHPIEAMRIDA